MASQRRTRPEAPADETDADLLLYMSMSADDPASARTAWEELYLRHAEYLYAVCLRAYGPLLGGAAGAADLVADTFQRAYEHAGTFDAAGIDDPVRMRRRARAWLGRIAHRLAMGALRSRSSLTAWSIQPDQWQQVAQEPARPDAAADPRIAAVRQAIEGLTEREQMVVRMTFQYHQAGREHQRLPNEVCADLAAALGTTPENLRQIRRRALKKIEACLRRSIRPDGSAVR